jgi:DNA-binding response OmpR family regulator
MRLLLVEDDVELADGLVSSLAQSGYTTDSFPDGHAALAAASLTEYALVILDLGLPGLDGLQVLRRMQLRRLTCPVLILTARDEADQRIAGLDAGADDYLGKPFVVAELEARIRALLRRGEATPTLLQFGSVTFDPVTRSAAAAGIHLDLTARELSVLELLLRRAGRTVSKRQLFESLYGWDDEASLAAIEVFVSRLRRKLTTANAKVGIRVMRGLGYRLEIERDADV